MMRATFLAMSGPAVRVHPLLLITLVGMFAGCGDSGNNGTTGPTGPTGPQSPLPVSYPAFAITSPTRGAMLQQGGLGADSVTVTGQACDPLYPITRLTLNGDTIPVSGTSKCESFSVQAESRWGLTIISGEAQNSQGTVGRLAQSFLRGPVYFPAAVDTDAAARVPHAVVTQLGPAVIADMAQILDSVTAHTDWDAAVGAFARADPDANGDGYIDTYTYTCGVPPVAYYKTDRGTGWEFRKDGVLTATLAPIGLTLKPDTGLAVTVDLPTLHLPLFVRGALDLECAGEVDATATGSIDASNVAFAGTIPLALGPGDPVPAVQDLTATIGDLNVNVDLVGPAFTDNIVSSALTAIVNLFHGAIGGLLAAKAGDGAHQALQQMLHALTTTYDAQLGLKASTMPDSATVPGNAIALGLATQLMPDGVRTGPAPARGPLRRDGAFPTFTGPSFDLGIAFKDDAVNQTFWAAWQHGLFDKSSLSDLGCDASVSGGAVSLSSVATLPPVLEPADGDSVAIGLGDLQLTGTVDRGAVGGTGAPLNVTLDASGIVTGQLGVNAANELTIGLAPSPQLALQVTAIDDSTALEAVRTAITPFFGCIMQQMSQAALAGITLPTFDFSSVTNLPAGTMWSLGSPGVGREGDYTILRGTVVVTP
jgi:hypothetical protein